MKTKNKINIEDVINFIDDDTYLILWHEDQHIHIVSHYQKEEENIIVYFLDSSFEGKHIYLNKIDIKDLKIYKRI